MLLGRKEIFPASLYCCGHLDGKVRAVGVRLIHFFIGLQKCGLLLLTLSNDIQRVQSYWYWRKKSSTLLSKSAYVDTPLAVPTQASHNRINLVFLERQLTHPLKMFADAA